MRWRSPAARRATWSGFLDGIGSTTEAATANFPLHSQAEVDTANETRGPLLLISGLEDHTVPDVSTRSTLKQHRHSSAVTDLKQFEGRGHSLTIDNGWSEVAEAGSLDSFLGNLHSQSIRRHEEYSEARSGLLALIRRTGRETARTPRTIRMGLGLRSRWRRFESCRGRFTFSLIRPLFSLVVVTLSHLATSVRVRMLGQSRSVCRTSG
jgi:hypothetical protein